MDSIYESIVSTIDQGYQSKKDSDYSYSSLSSSKDIADFNRNMQIVFKSKNDMSKEKTHKSMKVIKFNGEIIGYIGFSRYNIDGKKYLGIGNFMIIPRYQSSGHGTKVIKDLIDRYKDTYDEIYCYVEKENTKAIQFYKRIADVNTKNLTKHGYYVTLYSKGRSSSNESYTQEGYIKDDKDIYYNKDKFDSGEINLCFITGLSGSGKSTMGRSMSSKNVEHYEMDDVICNDNFSDANLKEYGSLIESFFKGPGKSFRLIKNDDENNEKVLNSHKNYEKEITQSFVKHALSYCKSHTKTKYVCDGIWTFMFINPEQLKDCAVYIKGTSSLKSGYRALKRDIGEDKRNGLNTLQIFKREFRRVKEDVLYAKQNQKELQSFRSYFEKQSTSKSYIEESKKDDDIFITIPDIDKDHIRTVIKTLSNDIDNFQDLLFIKVFDYNIAFDNGKPVGFILVRLKPLGNDKYAGSISIAVDPKQRRKGLAEFLTKNMIEDCRKEDRLEYLYWNALIKNTASIKLAKKLGFKFEGNKKGEEGMYKKFIYPLKKQMNESYIEESSKYPDEVPDEIIDLLKRLNSYDYGYVKDGKKIKGMKNFFENYKSLTISEFEKYEIGVCWDYVHYEAYWFSKHGYRYETFYIQVQDEDNDCPSHTYLVFYLPNSSKVYYFESSWGKYQGIEEFDSINELHKTIKDRHISSARSKCDPKTYFRNKYDAKSSSWEHLGCGEYMVKVSKGRIQLNESYTEESLNLLKKLDEEKVSKEILDTIKPIILTSQNKSKASKLSLDLKCEITEIDSGMVFILVLDGPQEKRDTEEARSLLKDLASKCKSELSDIVSKVDIGDGDEGCLFFTMDKGKIRRKRKDLLESYTLEFKESEVEGKSIVYFTKDITPQSLLKIYQFMTNPSHGVAPLHGNIGVKISTGEYGGHNFLSPSLIKDLVDYLHGVIVECNTAYVSKRNTTEDHWNTVKAHGFLDIANCDIMDEDGDFPLPVKDPYHIKNNYVGNHLKRYDSILMLSHFKGHAMAGYGGALKNMSIGMASSRGKLHIHTAGEGEDMMKADRDKFLESMVDADMSVMDYMGKENILYVNVANNLSIDCDCDAHPKDPDISDIGIFASTDPVALDQACIDAVYHHPEEKKRNLINRITSRNGTHTIDCAYEKGLGNKHYVILDIDQIIEESVIEEDASVIAAGAFLILYFGGIAALRIHEKIKPYLDEKKFVYRVKDGELNNVDKSTGYKSPQDAIVYYAMFDLKIRTAEKGVILYKNKSDIQKKVKLYKYNQKKEESVVFDGTYEELCEKYNVKLKEMDESKFKGRNESLNKVISILKQEISKYPVLKKGNIYDYSKLKSVPKIFQDSYYEFINGQSDNISLYNINLWDIGMKYTPRSDEGQQYADENIFGPIKDEVMKNISNKLPKGYTLDTDGDWDSLYIVLVNKVSSNESVIEEDIENEWAPASFLKRSSKPAKNQKAHAQYLKRKAHSNKTNNATAQSELPKYNQIGEESIEEVVKSQRVKPIFIVTSYTNTTFGKAIKTFTHSQYTHAAIAFDTSLEELYSFNADPKYNSNGYKGGISKESLSSYIYSYDKTIIQVNCIFLKPSDFDKVKETLDKLIENKEDTSYGYLNILNILIGRTKDTGMAMVCSQFVSYILSTADIRLLDKPDNIVTPKDLSTITNPRVYKIFEGYAKDYEKKRMDRIFRKLKTKALLIKESLLDLCI